jgi:hypothetical protein
LPDQYRDRVLENLPLDFRVNLLCLAVQQLRLGGHHIGFRGHAEFIAAFRDLQ